MADESLEEESSKPGRACEGSRRDLIKCLRESDCVKVVGQWKGAWLGGVQEIIQYDMMCASLFIVSVCCTGCVLVKLSLCHD